MLATYNRWNGRQEGLYSAAHALKNTNVDITMIQEGKRLDPMFATRNWSGYNIQTEVAGSKSRGSVALIVCSSNLFSAENKRVVETDVAAFEVVLNKNTSFLLRDATSLRLTRRGRHRR